MLQNLYVFLFVFVIVDTSALLTTVCGLLDNNWAVCQYCAVAMVHYVLQPNVHAHGPVSASLPEEMVHVRRLLWFGCYGDVYCSAQPHCDQHIQSSDSGAASSHPGGRPTYICGMPPPPLLRILGFCSPSMRWYRTIANSAG